MLKLHHPHVAIPEREPEAQLCGLLAIGPSLRIRSGDRLFHVLYERFPVGREMQLHMWSQFCQQVAAFSGGVRMSNVSVTTTRFS